MSTTTLFDCPPYAMRQPAKEAWLLDELNRLGRHHADRCPAYGRLLRSQGIRPGTAASVAEVPFLPVGLFKSHTLASVPASEVFKTLTSSGTTGQQVSRITLDRETAQLQSASLARIMSHLLGPRRLPMLIIDTPGVLGNRTAPSARAAGVLGMMSFGREHRFALDDQMVLDRAGLDAFLARHGGGPFLIFGFTFMVWQYFLGAIADAGLDLSQGVLVHGGGWKKLEASAVDNATFKRSLREATGLSRIYNFYGMVEQVGSVYLEGEDGWLYPPTYADVVIRDPVTFAPLPTGQVGLIEVLSALPRSYPGHAILTEDLGIVHGVDDSTCGRFGKRFSVLGRLPKAELRGCSDTHAYDGATP